MRKSARLIPLLWVLFPVATLHAADPLADVDRLVEQELVRFKVPGVAIGIVKDGKVVLLKGYGVRDAESRARVDPDTLFPIASITKSFTVASLGTLAREGRVDWDQPVRDVLPDFRLSEDYATTHATLRDLVTHRTGLPRHDWLWYGSKATRDELYHALPRLAFSKDIRTRFQYNNLMFMTAGIAGATVAKTTWEDLVKKSLFVPLGMTRSGFSVSAMKADANRAKGYEENDERALVYTEPTEAEALGPAGSIISSARDMVAYATMYTSGGEYHGQRVLLESDVADMLRPQMTMGDPIFPEFAFNAYGMGFFVTTYRGHVLAQHGGNLDGASAMLAILPRERIGIVILTNKSGTALRDSLTYDLADRLLGLPSAGWGKRWREIELADQAGEDAAKSAKLGSGRAGTRPSHPLAEYAGDYGHPSYGRLGIAARGAALELAYNGFTSPLDHFAFDVFRTPANKQNRLEQTKVQFVTDFDGEIDAVLVPLEDNVPAIRFDRKPPASMTARAFLEAFVGTYALSGLDTKVALREDDVLLLTFPAGRTFELVPVRGTTFRLKGRTDSSVEFLRDASGKVTGFGYYAGVNVVATRK